MLSKFNTGGYSPLEGPMIIYRYSTKDRGAITVITDKGKEYAFLRAKYINHTARATVFVLTPVKENF